MNWFTCLCLALAFTSTGCAAPQDAIGSRDTTEKSGTTATIVAPVAASSAGKHQMLYLKGVKIPRGAEGALVFVNPTPNEILEQNSPSFAGAIAPGQAKPGETPSTDFVLELNRPVRNRVTIVLRLANSQLRAGRIEIRDAIVADEQTTPKRE